MKACSDDVWLSPYNLGALRSRAKFQSTIGDWREGRINPAVHAFWIACVIDSLNAMAVAEGARGKALIWPQFVSSPDNGGKRHDVVANIFGNTLLHKNKGSFWESDLRRSLSDVHDV